MAGSRGPPAPAHLRRATLPSTFAAFAGPPRGRGVRTGPPRLNPSCRRDLLALVPLCEVKASVSDLPATGHPERDSKVVIASSHQHPKFTVLVILRPGFKRLKHRFGSYGLWRSEVVALPTGSSASSLRDGNNSWREHRRGLPGPVEETNACRPHIPHSATREFLTLTFQTTGQSTPVPPTPAG